MHDMALPIKKRKTEERYELSNCPSKNRSTENKTLAMETASDNPSSIDSSYFKSYSFCEVHALMLSDKRRTITYQLAIARAWKRLAGHSLLDVGCGSGILSMFGAKSGASPVIALDAAPHLTRLARQIIHENHLSTTITVVNARVEEAVLPVHRVDAIVSEWMGYGLLYENMLTSVLFARDKFLVPSSELKDNELATWRRERMFPCQANLFIAAICEDEQEQEEKVKNEESEEGPNTFIDMDHWNQLSNLYQVKLDGIFASEMQNEFVHQIHVELLDPKVIVSSADHLCSIDLAVIPAKEIEENGLRGSFDLRMMGMANVAGFVIWFSVGFPDGDELSTSPYKGATHWQQCLVYTSKTISMQQDDVVTGTVHFSHPFANKRDLDLHLECSFKDSKNVTQKAHFSQDYHLQN